MSTNEWDAVYMAALARKNGVQATKKRGKYGAVKTEVDGHTFASKRESERYQQLKAMVAAGEISGLELQPQFPMHVIDPQGVKHSVAVYRADFKFIRDGKVVVEDSKGMVTPVFSLKRKHVETEYGIRIELT